MVKRKKVSKSDEKKKTATNVQLLLSGVRLVAVFVKLVQIFFDDWN